MWLENSETHEHLLCSCAVLVGIRKEHIVTKYTLTPSRYDAYGFLDVRMALMGESSLLTVSKRRSTKASVERLTGTLDCGPRKLSMRRSGSI